ncbi:MAG: metallophosphoesterase [Geminicoccaceae bacterium]|nr:metallophosphoesterase [Geminicoccaceae bacterium]
MSAGSTFELAHLTDMHIGPMPLVRKRELALKRFFGFLSWRRRRHLLHRVDVLDAIVADLADDPPDHTVVTGDLVNIALPVEFEQAAAWLARLGTPHTVSAIPGNHDAYAGRRYRDGWDHWRAHMCDDEANGTNGILFPYLRRRGRVAIVGMSSAVPSPIGYAYGRLGDGQLEAVDAMLADLGREGAFRVVLVHHPPLASISRRRELRDAAGLRSVVRRHGAELILAGHEHHYQLSALPGPRGPVPVVVGPSASLFHEERGATGGYLRYAVDTERNAVILQMRRFDQESCRLERGTTGRIEADGDGFRLRSSDWPAVEG